MKRATNLWGQITDLENIKLAHKQARRGKAHYSEVKMVDADVDKYALEIQQMLINKTFTTSTYDIEERFDGRKIRTIYKLPYYPDRIVQHALLNIVGPIIERSLIRDTFQSIRGRGTSDAAKRVKLLVRSENAPQYALKIDIKKYYPSVDNTLLKIFVQRKIKCVDTFWLLDNIIESTQGLPIGNYTSQHFGNLYLSEFDWWVKQQIKPRGYFRYCDDILVFGDSPSQLLTIKNQMIQKLSKLKLLVKQNWSIVNVENQGVDFVGFVFRPNKTRLRRSIAKNFKTTCTKLVRNIKSFKHPLSSLMSYKGWVKQANAKKLWRTHTTYPALRQTFKTQLRGAV